jgi:hypothetical protein
MQKAMHIDFGEVDWIGALTTLIAAFGGTYFAFVLERRHRRKEEVQKQLTSAKQAIVSLSDMYSVVVQYRQETVEPYRTKDDAWLNMPAQVLSRPEFLKIDHNSLAYLLDSRSPNTLPELIYEQRRFADWLDAIERRDRIVRERLMPGLGTLFRPGSFIDSDKFGELVGYHTEHEMRNLTAAIIERSDQLMISLLDMQNRLRDLMGKVHPEKFTFKFVADPKPMG